MSTQDDNNDNIPTADEPASVTEKRQAKEFVDLTESVLAGERLPPAMAPDQRSLASYAAMIRAATRDVALRDDARSRLIDQALTQTAKASRPTSISAIDAIRPVRPEPHGGGEPSSGKNLLLPWSIALVACAAALALWLGTRDRVHPEKAALPLRELKEIHSSRHADALIGAIARENSGRASARIDMIFADRMDGYRDLKLTSGVRR